jgi:hypothetical protein
VLTALIGLAGVIGGLVLGGVGKYFTQRRDAWLEARAAGLMLLADVRRLHSAIHDGSVVAAELGVKSWEQQREALARFRRGSYPSGLKAPEWLRLAAHFAQLQTFSDSNQRTRQVDARCELKGVVELLTPFERDPAVLPYVLKTGLHKVRKRLRRASSTTGS